MQNERQNLIDLVREGTIEVISELQAAYRDDPLRGLALLTDDDLGGIFAVSCTASFLSNSEDSDVQFVPTDWPHICTSPETLDQASAILEERSRSGLTGEEWVARRRQDFSAIVEGFAQALGQLLPDSFLTVGSTDPGPLLEELEDAAVLRLNSPDIVLRWRRGQLEGAKVWLSRLEAKPAPLSYADEWDLQELRKEVARLENLV